MNLCGCFCIKTAAAAAGRDSPKGGYGENGRTEGADEQKPQRAKHEPVVAKSLRLEMKTAVLPKSEGKLLGIIPARD